MERLKYSMPFSIADWLMSSMRSLSSFKSLARSRRLGSGKGSLSNSEVVFAWAFRGRGWTHGWTGKDYRRRSVRVQQREDDERSLSVPESHMSCKRRGGARTQSRFHRTSLVFAPVEYASLSRGVEESGVQYGHLCLPAQRPKRGKVGLLRRGGRTLAQ